MSSNLPKTIYHYASLDRLTNIQATGELRGRRLGTVHHDAYNEIVVFCLENPRPAEWLNNVEFDHAWGKLRAQVGKLLLEIDIDGIQDQVKVVDWATMERHLQGPEETFSRHTAESDYLASRRSFADFIADRSSTSLPELILPSPIAIERIRVAKNQPDLDYLLSGGYLGDFREDLLRQVARTPELTDLHRTHQKWLARIKRAWQNFLLRNRQSKDRQLAQTL